MLKFQNRCLLFIVLMGIMLRSNFSYGKSQTYPQKKINKCYLPKKKGAGRFIMQTTADLIKDTLEINKNVFTSMDTVKTIVGITPFYLATRMVDTSIHNKFYTSNGHKNKHQLPSLLTKIVSKSGDVGIVLLTSFAIFSSDEKMRLVARIFGLGAFSALVAKDAFKEIKIDAGLRPWNEHFNCHKRAHGGFPSGHMVEAAYMTTVWGLQYGLKAWIPLGLFSGLMFGVLVNSNRHYVSQVVAGAGLGIIYGLAANTLITKKLNQNFSFNVSAHAHGAPQLEFSYCF